MSIRAPSANLAPPTYETLQAGSPLHRVHLTAYGGTSFNPCAGQPTRFAPIVDANGSCVPSLYAGSSLDSVIYETIFHDVPARAAFKTVRRQEVLIRSHAELQTGRRFTLVSLRQPDLKRWRIGRSQLIASGPKLYPKTARWAEAIHHRFPKADGLVWTSNQCDPDSAYLFFGDRVAPADFVLAASRNGATDKSFLADVRQAGRRAGIVITI
ncbi:MAG: RES domain-containing protein [Sphingomonadales bacterium]|nr:RES domain-containing protein [Sphingomonadales bacterium]